MTFRHRLAAAVALAGTVALAPAVAEEDGARLYRDRCATCHGIDATGGGPMAPLISVPLPDLTQLAARGGGFPLAAVIEIIDGRTPLRAHGGPMPVFGPVGAGPSAAIDGPDGSVLETSAGVLALARYLEGLQKPAP